MLTRLASDPDNPVRLAVARNPHSPVNILKMLTGDKSSHVAHKAKMS
jgi:hypothetical protein